MIEAMAGALWHSVCYTGENAFGTRMKKVLDFLLRYKLLSLALLGIIAGGILDPLGYHTAAHWVLGTVSIIAVMPILWQMFQDIRSGRYGIDILAATAIITSVLLRQYWAGIVIVVMYTGGKALEDFAQHRARVELDALLTRSPQMAHVIRARKTIDMKASEVTPGSTILIKTGEVVPVDAEIIEGSVSFDESSLTGESVPQVKGTGETILSGSIALDGSVTAQAIHSAADSQYEQIIKLVRSAAANQSPFVRLADRYSIPFTITAYAIAVAAWVIGRDPIRFLEVIVVATPCPLLLAAPIALISGMSRAARHGIIVRTGSALEKLAEAKTIAFDKTGTLTVGKPVVDAVTAYDGFTEADVLGMAASLEQNSSHVLAIATVAGAEQRHIKPAKAKHVRELPGKGLMAIVQGKEVLVGRVGFMSEQGIAMPESFSEARIRQTATYVAIGGNLAGTITYKDELRPDAQSTVSELKALGMTDMLMITGDHPEAAKAVAKAVGIKDFRAEALPADKLLAIESLPDKPVVFVGDGVNDAPVLTAADVGIALGARGSTAASESADLVIMLDDFSRVARAVSIAKRTFSVARQSILVGIGLSLVLMLIFSTGILSPIIGAVLQEVVDVIVIFNALRAHNGAHKSSHRTPVTTAAV